MNVMIVDDMKSVVDGMEKGIKWEHIGVSGVYKAYNAAEAKVLLRNIPIDILMTDVEMPGESGLDLVNWVRMENMDIECIILSSHPNFEYAQRAISLNSFNYILLPCSYYEIESIVLKTVQSISKKREQNKLAEYGKLIREDWLDTVLFEGCLDKQTNQEMVRKLHELYHIDTEQTGYLCLISADGECDIIKQCDNQLLLFMFNNVLREILASFQERLYIQQTDKLHYIFLVCSENGRICDDTMFRHQIELIIETIGNILQIPVDICFERCNGFSDLPDIYQTLQYRKKIVSQYIQEETVNEKEVLPVIREYVRNHINQDIKRSDLAELVHLNIDYLSRIFKRDTGMTLNDYIVNEKISVAQNLLRTTKLPVNLIATKVGYSNFSYFSKLYKKINGVSPVEERMS